MNVPRAGWSSRSSISRAAICGCLNISSIVRIGPDGNSLAIEQLDPVVGRMSFERAIDLVGQRRAIADPEPDALKRVVGIQLGPPDHVHELRPHRFVADRDIERAVGRHEYAVRRRERMMVAVRRGCLAGLEIDAGRPAQHAHDRFEQRSLDPLAAPGAMARLEREQNSLRGEDSAEQVADRDSDPRRSALRCAGHAHQPRHALRDLIEAGIVAQRPGRAEARDAAGDDARIACRQCLVAEAHRIDDAGAEIVDHDIGRIDQPFQQRAAVGDS